MSSGFRNWGQKWNYLSVLSVILLKLILWSITSSPLKTNLVSYIHSVTLLPAPKQALHFSHICQCHVDSGHHCWFQHHKCSATALQPMKRDAVPNKLTGSDKASASNTTLQASVVCANTCIFIMWEKYLEALVGGILIYDLFNFKTINKK